MTLQVADREGRGAPPGAPGVTQGPCSGQLCPVMDGQTIGGGAALCCRKSVPDSICGVMTRKTKGVAPLKENPNFYSITNPYIVLNRIPIKHQKQSIILQLFISKWGLMMQSTP